MKSQYPVLPDYRLSWRSIQVEPIPHSGERIGVGAIVKGEDHIWSAPFCKRSMGAAKVRLRSYIRPLVEGHCALGP